MMDEVERIARIIDPEPWEMLDRCRRLGIGQEMFDADAANRSLEKARLILARPAPASQHTAPPEAFSDRPKGV